MNPVSSEKLLADNWPMSLARCPNEEDGAFDGSCPCGRIEGDGFAVEFHCWRSKCSHGCEYSGIHVTGTIGIEEMKKIARHIRDNNGWTDRTDWTLTVNGVEIE